MKIDEFHGLLRVTRISSTDPEHDNKIQVQIDIREPERKRIVLTLDPEAFGIGLTGLGQPCKIEIGMIAAPGERER